MNQKRNIAWGRVFSCALLLMNLNGCGQRSGLTLPSDEEAKRRASLPQILIPKTMKPSNASQTNAGQEKENANNSASNPANSSSNSPSKPVEK